MDAGEALSDDPNRPNSAADAAPAPAGARYKLLSPAKLPISRSPCVTISPGVRRRFSSRRCCSPT
ncbi:hypothetical protein glysoja_035667 [Glycine soja]|uniref:Uncharacterized protein n=1 Tax=Glycine soja TaxID=3848 RepID=A0A0B2SHU1_GLYSO|nr:hypothetical protein glysoja_035667 [Glycine soja]